MSVQNFFLLSDLNLPVTIKISSVDGLEIPDQIVHQAQLALAGVPNASENYVGLELYITCEIFSSGVSLCAPVHTQCYLTSSSSIRIDEWLTFSALYKDLAPSSALVCTIWQLFPSDAVVSSSAISVLSSPQIWSSSSRPSWLGEGVKLTPIGGCNMPLFNKAGRMKLGSRRLQLTRDRDGDGNLNTTTPYKLTSSIKLGQENPSTSTFTFTAPPPPSINKIESRLRSHILTTTSQCPSLFTPPSPWLDRLSANRISTLIPSISNPDTSTECLCVCIDMAPFRHPVVFHQPDTTPVSYPAIRPPSDPSRVIVVIDPEAFAPSPIAAKFNILSQVVGHRYIRPTPEERHRLEWLIKQPTPIAHPPPLNTYILTRDDKELIMRHRYSLTKHASALVKYLHVINWGDLQQSREAIHMLDEWTPISPTQALELVSSTFKHPQVRAFGARVIGTSTDTQLLDLLLQLVQALRYEVVTVNRSVPMPSPDDVGPEMPPYMETVTVPSHTYPHLQHHGALCSLLIARACHSRDVCNWLYWYLVVETSDKHRGDDFARVLELLKATLRLTVHGRRWLRMLEEQVHLLARTNDLFRESCVNKNKVDVKLKTLRLLLSDSSEQARFSDLITFARPVAMPLNPDAQLVGMVGSKCTIFKSAKTPLLATYNLMPGVPGVDVPLPTEKVNHVGKQILVPGGEYRTIFKCGDDLRQDQLVLQLFAIMNSQLQTLNLDLKLTSYKVLATSPDDGFVEFVANSHTIQDILQNFGSELKSFFQHYNKSAREQAEVLDTFVRSCAGYCVLTYLLGIGDRHLENLLITPDGHMFHIDFGFIFGKDPKPFQPSIRLSKEMVVAMGGQNSVNYADFKRFCCVGFNILRRYAGETINYLNLMKQANIPGFDPDPNYHVQEVLERFKLHLNDEEAEHHLLGELEKSLAAVFAVFTDKIHSIASNFR